MATRGERARAALVVTVSILLAACGAAHSPDAARPPASPLAAEPSPQAAPTTPTPEELSSLEPEANRPPELLGLSREQVASLLGTPSLRRREAPAEVWQYVGRSCVLHVFLYQEPNGVRVAHYESAVRSGRRVTARDCYDRLFDESARRGGES